MQAMHSQPPTRYSLTLSVKGLLSGNTNLMSNIISTNDNLQLALGFRIRNQRGSSCHSLVSSILGLHQRSVGTRGRRQRLYCQEGCYWTEHETGANHLCPGWEKETVGVFKRGAWTQAASCWKMSHTSQACPARSPEWNDCPLRSGTLTECLHRCWSGRHTGLSRSSVDPNHGEKCRTKTTTSSKLRRHCF